MKKYVLFSKKKASFIALYLILMALAVCLSGCTGKAKRQGLGTWYAVLDPTVQGDLECRINSAENRISGIDKNKFLEDAGITLEGRNYSAGQCVDDRGNLIDGAEFIVLNVTVWNKNAHNTDADVSGPDVFRADSLAYLDDTEESDHGSYAYSSTSWFSELNQQAEHPMAFKLQPGEKRTMELGFLLGENRNGNTVNLTGVCASPASGNKDAVLIELNLK